MNPGGAGTNVTSIDLDAGRDKKTQEIAYSTKPVENYGQPCGAFPPADWRFFSVFQLTLMVLWHPLSLSLVKTERCLLFDNPAGCHWSGKQGKLATSW